MKLRLIGYFSANRPTKCNRYGAAAGVSAYPRGQVIDKTHEFKVPTFSQRVDDTSLPTKPKARGGHAPYATNFKGRDVESAELERLIGNLPPLSKSEDTRDYSIRPLKHQGRGVSSAELSKLFQKLPSDGNPTPSPPRMNLTARNLELQGKELNRSFGAEELGPAQTTVNERLKQAINFLSDEDENLRADFVRRHKELTDYISQLAKEGVKYDLKLYNQVCSMLSVHQSRIYSRRSEIPQISNNSTLQSHDMYSSSTGKIYPGNFRGLTPRDESSHVKATTHGAPVGIVKPRSSVANRELHDEENFHSKVSRHPSDAPHRQIQLVKGSAESEDGLRAYYPPFVWTERYFNLMKQEKGHPSDQSLIVLSKPLDRSGKLPSIAEARELLGVQILRENCEKMPARPQHEANWAFASRLATANVSRPYSSVNQRSNSKTSINELDPLHPTQHWADVQKKRKLDHLPSKDMRSEELAYQEHRDGSPERSPKLGHGALMPSEMRNFDFEIDGQLLENAPDRKEVHVSGEPVFQLGETPYVQAIMSNGKLPATELPLPESVSALNSGRTSLP